MAAQLDPTIRAFLDEVRFATLATISEDGTPQQTVMWYLLQDDAILMNTRRGRTKDRNIRRDPRVSLCFEAGYDYVTIAGVLELIDDHDRTQADIHALATRYHGRERADAMMRETFGPQHRITMLLPLAGARVDVHGFGRE